MNKIFFLPAVIFLVFVTTSPVSADIRGRELTVSPFFGATIYDGAEDLGPNFTTGLRVGYNLTRNLGVEGQFSYGLAKSSDRTFHEQYGLRGDTLFHFMPENNIVPFIAAGGGWSRAENSSGVSDNGMFDYGAGVKFFIDHSVALRFDVRQIYSFHSDNNSTNAYWQNSEFTVGLTYQFGGARPPAPVVEGFKPIWLAEETTAPPGKNLITGMKVEQNALEITASERIVDYKVFTLSQPSRLVIDIGNTVSGFRMKSIQIDRLGIATVRFESHPEFLRIFLDAAQGRLIPYRIEETDKGLKIIMTEP